MQFGVDLVDDFAKVIVVVREVVMICFDNKHSSEFVGLDPGFVPLIQPFKVIEPYRALIFTSSLLNLVNERGNRRPEVEEEVRGFNEGTHHVEEGGIVFEVAC